LAGFLFFLLRQSPQRRMGLFFGRTRRLVASDRQIYLNSFIWVFAPQVVTNTRNARASVISRFFSVAVIAD
jgi:hypothetical protein